MNDATGARRGVAHGLTRRALLAVTSAAMLGACAAPLSRKEPSFEERVIAIRSRIGGRVGIYARDTHSGRHVGSEEASRFAMASTFKLFLAAAVLSSVDSGALSLEQSVPIRESDLVPHAPVTSKYVAQGAITVRELCAAIIEVSDNPAANLLLSLVDGPPGFTRFMRIHGDNVTRLDRYELELNTNLPGDERDTTTPRAMVASMEQVLTRRVLSESSRNLLIGWLVNSSTGLERIRAGLPGDWKVGDKTGSGSNGAINDVAIAWPTNRAPILIAIYLSGSTLPVDALNAAHAEIADLVVRRLAPGILPQVT